MSEEKKFVEAAAMEIKDKDGNSLSYRWKGIVNADDTTQMFSIVGKDYRIVQHAEVEELLCEAVENKRLVAEKRNIVMNDGGRVHFTLKFPDERIVVKGQELMLRITLDNSYDGSTGLRTVIGACSPSGKTLYYVSEGYYHKHTKGLRMSTFEKALDKGVDSFFNKIKDNFESMASKEIAQMDLADFIERAKDSKVIPIKYLTRMEDDLPTVSNLWELFGLICEVLSDECKSIDMQRTYCTKMLSRLRSFKWA